MAQIPNPRKQFKFSIEIIGVPMNPYLAQNVEHPEIDIEPVPHGDINYEVKTAGMIRTGNATITKLMTTSGPDNFMFNWHTLCQDVILGGGAVPDVYKRKVLVTEFAEDGQTILNVHEWYGCWPTKIQGQTNDRTASENTMEIVELSVDFVNKTA